ncbi:hypothetical protein NPX13_g8840 [Xylaria arbuscula]|uniref:Chitin biosynthesis protein n=1 Tax=Xylaria arbuscula TaxID=114810 RepID=A0A9W8TJS3_9PEZI|nr:hypothetical protein NPX13_g8840 [Xylaria arbuscula]
MLVSLTVGKVDAGVTVLLTPDKRLIEFPSILLPPNIVSGSIVDITVARNHASESESDKRFATLQDKILACFGHSEPSTPTLRCRNVTQTVVVLEWSPIELATADLISLTIYRNGQKLTVVPGPLQVTRTKITGLAVDTEYNFHLVLRTSAGTFSSERLVVRTHKMTNLSGIIISTGILPAPVRETVAAAVERIGAKIIDAVNIETTHFVTTEGRGVPWEKAREMNIPVVRPEWVTACEQSGRILGVTKFYLDAAKGEPTSTADKSAPTPPQTQKELPTAPPSAENGESEDATGKGKESASSEEDAKTGTSEADNAKAKSAEEQKMRLEDKEEQMVAIHPNPKKQATAEDDNDGGAGDEKQPAPSPGDGSSFQEIAL